MFPAQEGHWSFPRAVARTVTTILSCVRSCLQVPNAGAPSQQAQLSELSPFLLPYFEAVLGEISTSAHGTEKFATSTKCLQSQSH